MCFPNRSDTNRPVPSQKRARSLKFRILVEEEMYYPSSENKGADQLRGYREADLRLCFRLSRLLVSHGAAQIMITNIMNHKRGLTDTISCPATGDPWVPNNINKYIHIYCNKKVGSCIQILKAQDTHHAQSMQGRE